MEVCLDLAEAAHVLLSFGDLFEVVFFLDVCGLVEIPQLVEAFLQLGGLARRFGDLLDEEVKFVFELFERWFFHDELLDLEIAPRFVAVRNRNCQSMDFRANGAQWIWRIETFG